MQDRWDAKKYAKSSASQELWAKELIEKIDLQGDEKILDIGCGDGKITNFLAELTSSQVTGIDASSSMIALAQKSYVKPIFIEMDAQKIDLGEKFDVVFSNAALHWIQNHDLLLRGVKKALKANGRIVFQMGGYGNAKRVFEALDMMQKYKKYFNGFKFPYKFYSDTYYKKLLFKHGFEESDVKLINKEMIHKDTDSFRRWLETTWFPYLERLPESLQKIFLEELMESYFTLVPPDSQKRVHVDMVRLEVKAKL